MCFSLVLLLKPGNIKTHWPIPHRAQLAFLRLILAHTHIPAGPSPYRGLMVDVVPGDDVVHARGHGGTDGEYKALFEGPAEQAQHTVPIWAVREVGYSVRPWVSYSWVWMLWLDKPRAEINK